MKKLNYIIIFFLAVVLYGCSDILDTEPLGFTATANFYKDANDVEIALTGCYGLFGQSYSVNYRTGMFLIGNVGTDEVLGNPYSTPDAPGMAIGMAVLSLPLWIYFLSKTSGTQKKTTKK